DGVRPRARAGLPDRGRSAGRRGDVRYAREDGRPGQRAGEGVLPRVVRGGASEGDGTRTVGGSQARDRRAAAARPRGTRRIRGDSTQVMERLISVNPPLVLALIAMVTVQLFKFLYTWILRRRLDFTR